MIEIPDLTEVFLYLFEIVVWEAVAAYVSATLVGLWGTFKVRQLVKRFIAYRMAKSGKAIATNHVRLRDQKVWEIKEITFAWVQLRRYEGTGERKKAYTKWVRVEEWVVMEITTVQ